MMSSFAPTKTYGSVVFVHTWGMGDLVMVLPFLRGLKATRLTVLASSGGVIQLAQSQLACDGIQVDLRSARDIFNVALQLRKLKPDLLLFCPGISDYKVEAFAAAVGAVKSIATKTTRWRLSCLSRQVAFDGQSHFSENCQDLFSAVGVQAEAFPLKPIEKTARRDVLIHPGCDARNSYRRWPIARFQRLVKELKSLDIGVEMVLGPSEMGLADLFAECTVHSNLPLSRLFELIADHKLLVCSDSGVGHIANGLSVPVVTLFGPGDPNKTAPLGSEVDVIKPIVPLPCMPCVRPGGRYGCLAQTCLEFIPVQRVVDAICSRLRPSGGVSKPVCDEEAK